MATAPLILEIRGNSLDDGPGIRTVVFFKGCPLACTWCHNPESQQRGAEIGFEASLCIGCDTCLGVCSEKALDRSTPWFVDRARCTLCFACSEACPSGALGRVGRPMEVEEIIAMVLKDKPFFDTSGGGVTLSGGEPTLHTAFLSGLLQALKGFGIHTLVETCGQFHPEGFIESVLPWVDTVYFDLKIMDDRAHRRHCGPGNQRILDNFAKLAALGSKGRFELLPRTPLIPGITDTEENLGALVDFLHQTGQKRIQLLEYNPLGLEKRAKIGRSLGGDTGSLAKDWMPKEHLLACRACFQRAGIATV